ncbi:hypothetical protein SPRG_15183 [Saprolegnia parasitica CBS 223.65]|uniref:Uncharacterized protein n=1 Tax=Saprolegnia parasitica (strain CBS 223.65) TaxID=695850 RepID=A0A067BYZ5_SAPPC|nr:hypothetical protein SPRG_15183 [Saprolegnia parasitica CBS 223.65]KDO19546.1 hypothetical protein SPRG_15183 [Saprolegnia parasitica CBS 223.65]|eukprot:XP_012209733.1 hypothetical protein SPRG_15183 [Saprolegnia parasitica CBS 223.65]
MPPSLRSPHGFLSEEHSYTMEDPTLLSSRKETPRIGTATYLALPPRLDANTFLDPTSQNASTRNDTMIVFPGHDMNVPLAASAFATYHVQVYAIFAGASVLMVVFRTLATSCAATLVPFAVPPVSSRVYNSDMVTLDTKLPFAAAAFLANVFIAAFALGTSKWFLQASALPISVVLYGYY